MTVDERATATRDEHYDLVSVLYHTLQEAETIQRYIDDADRTGDTEVAKYFKDVQEQDRQRAQRAKDLLGKRLQRGA